MCPLMVLYIAKLRKFLSTSSALIYLVYTICSIISYTDYLKPFVFLDTLLLQLIILILPNVAWFL